MEIDVAYELTKRGYTFIHAYPLAHQAIEKFKLSGQSFTLEEVVDEVISFHPILGFDQLAHMNNALRQKNSWNEGVPKITL